MLTPIYTLKVIFSSFSPFQFCLLLFELLELKEKAKFLFSLISLSRFGVTRLGFKVKAKGRPY